MVVALLQAEPGRCRDVSGLLVRWDRHRLLLSRHPLPPLQHLLRQDQPPPRILDRWVGWMGGQQVVTSCPNYFYFILQKLTA